VRRELSDGAIIEHGWSSHVDETGSIAHAATNRRLLLPTRLTRRRSHLRAAARVVAELVFPESRGLVAARGGRLRDTSGSYAAGLPLSSL
jgi:hypothetical protein